MSRATALLSLLVMGRICIDPCSDADALAELGSGLLLLLMSKVFSSFNISENKVRKFKTRMITDKLNGIRENQPSDNLGMVCEINI